MTPHPRAWTELRGDDDRTKWLAALIQGYEHYPETFGEEWPKVLADSLACHLWPDDPAPNPGGVGTVTTPTERQEWELTGQPHGSICGKPFPPYRFVFGNPNEGDREGTPEQRARDFIALAAVEWTNVRLRSRVIVEYPWQDEETGLG